MQLLVDLDYVDTFYQYQLLSLSELAQAKHIYHSVFMRSWPEYINNNNSVHFHTHIQSQPISTLK